MHKHRIKTIRKHYDGFFINPSVGKAKAKVLLRKYPNGQAWISSWNGQNLYIKERGKIRESHMGEFIEFIDVYLKHSYFI